MERVEQQVQGDKSTLGIIGKLTKHTCAKVMRTLVVSSTVECMAGRSKRES